MEANTKPVKVGEDLLTLENLSEDEHDTLIDQVNTTIQDMAEALNEVEEGTAKVTLEITIKKFGPMKARDVESKISTALKAGAKKGSRELVQSDKGLVIERFEQPQLFSLTGGASGAA